MSLGTNKQQQQPRSVHSSSYIPPTFINSEMTCRFANKCSLLHYFYDCSLVGICIVDLASNCTLEFEGYQKSSTCQCTSYIFMESSKIRAEVNYCPQTYLNR